MNLGNTLFGNSSTSVFKNITGVGSVVSLFVRVSFVLAGLILLFFFIMGGIGLIGSAGNDNPQKAEQSKKTITSAIIGFVIVFASYWIVKLVGDILGITNLI
jgi:hypothetical protein